MCAQVNNNEHRALYTRYTLSTTKDSIIPEFQEKLDILNLSDYYEALQDRIIGPGKRKIVFKGVHTAAGNQTAKLKSLKDFSIFVLDEAEESLTKTTSIKSICLSERRTYQLRDTYP